MLKIFISFILLILVTGCSYKSTDTFFIIDSDNWTNEYSENIYKDKNKTIRLTEIKVNSFLLDRNGVNFGIEDGKNKKLNSGDKIHEFNKFNVMVIYEMDKKNCYRNDLKMKINNSFMSPKFAYMNGSTSSMITCQYRFDINPKNVDTLSIHFNSKEFENVPPIDMRKVTKNRTHYVSPS